MPDDPNGGLSGFKKSLLEGGIRVPAVIEWPGVIAPRVTHHPASAMDFFPTVAEIVGLPASSMMQPQDGLSLYDLFLGELPGGRQKDIFMTYSGVIVLIHNDLKLVRWETTSRWHYGTHARRFHPNRTQCSDAGASSTARSECTNAWKRLPANASSQVVMLFNLSADQEERYNLWGADDLWLAQTAVRIDRRASCRERV